MKEADCRNALLHNLGCGLRSSFVIRHSSFLCAFLLAMLTLPSRGQSPVTNQTDPLLQLMMSQPAVDIQSPVVARAAFDPPVIRAGGETVYRVTLNAMRDSITQWPDELIAPAQLQMKPGARGQILQLAGNAYQPLTIVNYRVRATAAGSFLVPQFLVDVYGKPVTVPGVRLQVVEDSGFVPVPVPRLMLEFESTNVFLGQTITARVLSPASTGTVVQPLAQVEFNGEGFLTGQSTTIRQRIQVMPLDGRQVPTFVYENSLTPVAAGSMEVSAQAFSGGRLGGTVIISGQATIPGGSPQYSLLESDPVTLNVRPLPREGELPGFAGGIGEFERGTPWLTTNTIRVGEPVKLTVLVQGDESLQRLVAPPPPRLLDWQVYPGEDYMTNITGATPRIVPANPPGLSGALMPGPAKAFAFTLVPLNEDSRATPAIPFSYFDPERRKYVDISIPPVPVKVLPGTAATNDLAWLRSVSAENPADDKPVFHGLAKGTGSSSASLVPLQARPGFILAQLLPVAGFAALWAWDKRRRYLKAHPDIVRRRRARRLLRRQRHVLRAAARAGDAPRYAANAVNALQIVCAPHYPAEPRALVCGDVLRLLDEPGRSNGSGQVVRQFFAVTDAASFSASSPDAGRLLGLQEELEGVLKQLEQRL
jgi:hypothetical protein